MTSTRKRSVSKEPEQSKEKEGAPLEIEFINRQRKRPIDRSRLTRLARVVLDRIGRTDATLTITFVRDPRMRALNREYRGIDKPTDVLSFLYQEEAPELDFNKSNHLGDVVVSVETAERYAGELGLTFDQELEHLVIHGALHLAGYDHETDDGEMNRLEKRLRKQFLK
jgi:probable rRNA maturation factor